MYSHVETKAFRGLYLNRNSFTVPDGALEQAENCVIAKDNVIEKRRGFYTFLSPAGGTTLNNVYTYQEVLMALYNSKMQWVSSGGTGTDLTGETITLSGGRIGRFCESNSNLYVTTDNGVKKLEAYNSAVYTAGTPPALDLRGKFAAANGPIDGTGDSTTGSAIPGCQVNFRVVFGRRDANNNLLLGAPSDIFTIINRPNEDESFSRSGSTVTVTTASPHNLATGMTVKVTDSTESTIEGTYTITVTSATVFTYSAGSGAVSGTLTWGTTRNTNLEFSIPSEVDSTSYFYQIYRSSQSEGADIVADLDFKLTKEVQLTSAEIAADVVFYTDSVADIFLGAELYTNPNSREGELQKNDRPPLCDDIALYKNTVFYANTTSRHLLNLSLITSSSSVINSGDYIEVQVGATTRRYVARTGVGNDTTPSTSVAGTDTLTVTYAAHGLSNGDQIYVSNVAGGSFAAGTYTVSSVAANTFEITGTGTATSLDFQGWRNSSGYGIFTLDPGTTSVATGIDTTARGLVKAIDRDTSSQVYARYTATAVSVPGTMYLVAKGFGDPIYVRANTTTVGTAFYPNLPTSFGSVVSSNDVLPNSLFYSKEGEPEAVPLVNSLPVGSRNKAILRIFPLRDSLIVLKEDGVYRIDGDRGSNFQASIIDSTIVCLVPNSAALLNNEVFFLSNQGVVSVSNSSVQIISREIEDPLTPIYGYDELVAQTAAMSDESARLYLLSTLEPNTSEASVVWCYNTLTTSWTTWDTYFKAGCIGPGDAPVLISQDNTLLKQRKNFDRTDYADESYSVSITSVDADALTAVLVSADRTPQAGDIVVYNDLINVVASATAGVGDFTVVFHDSINLVASTTATLYAAYTATIKFSPFTGGQTNRAKQFAQMQVRPRDNSISRMNVSFTTDLFGGSIPVEWVRDDIGTDGGWGMFPWGFAPWGQAQGIDLNFLTTPAAPIRVYVPIFSQRGAFIQAVLTHSTAGEPMNIQAIGFQVRGYGERTSR